MDVFWINDPYILLKNYSSIVPSNSESRIKQMNSVTRFLIYFLILCTIFDSEEDFVLYIIIALILIVVFYYIYKTDEIGIANDLISQDDNSRENFLKLNNYIDDTMNKPLIDLYDNKKNNVTKNDIDSNIEVQSGYIDSNQNYKIGRDYSDINIKDYAKQENDKKKKKVSWEKNELYKKTNYKKPTAENPFMNIVMSDYLDGGNIAEPINVDSDIMQSEMQNLYNSSIYRNMDDVFERENSQRIFYSMPIRTIPNDQSEFANWLYLTAPSCHEDNNNCTYYESPQMSSQRY